MGRDKKEIPKGLAMAVGREMIEGERSLHPTMAELILHSRALLKQLSERYKKRKGVGEAIRYRDTLYQHKQ